MTVAVVLCVAVALIFIGGFKGKSTSSDQSGETFYAYNQEMENKLKAVISAVDGVGDVSVALTYSSGVEKVYAYETKKQSSGGNSTESSVLVTVGGSPVVLRELPPQVSGVVVVAQGAQNPVVKMHIIQIVETLLGVDGDKVQVLN